MTSSLLKKGAFCTDIHFGKKANSEMHNQDCINYLQWFCDNVKQDQSIDYVAFLGDWNENRSALNISTLNYSYKGARMLNELGLPVFFIVGNHDLYMRHSREVHSVIPFNEFDNFTMIDQPTVIDQIHDRVLFCPYLFHDEYEQLGQHFDVPFWAGHFEFKGFLLTGYGLPMPTGPDPKHFAAPDHIVSGHFHKRQADGNICYIGNTFPMDFGDAGDNDRGLMTYDHIKKQMLFTNWDDCPKYTKGSLSDILNDKLKIYPNSRVKCIVDIPITFEESSQLREACINKYNLREFTLEESHEIKQAISETTTEIEWDDEDGLASVNELVLQMLKAVESDQISSDTLVSLYQNLRTHN